MNRLGNFMDHCLSEFGQGRFRVGLAAVAFAFVMMGLTGGASWAETAVNLDFLISSPGLFSAPRLAQNESSLMIDLNRNTTEIESVLALDAGQSVQAALRIDNVDLYRGYTLRVQFDPPSAVAGGTSGIAFTPGDLPGSGSSAVALVNSGVLFAQDIVIQSGPPVDVSGNPSVVFGFDFTTAASFNGNLKLHVIRQNDATLPPVVTGQLAVLIPNPNDGSTVSVAVNSTNFDTNDGTLIVTGPTPTPTLSPTQTATPGETDTPTPTPTPTEVGTFPPTATPWKMTGVNYLDRDLLIPKGQTLILDPGTELIFQAFTDNNNLGLEASLGEIIVEGALRIEGGDDGNFPVRIYSEVFPTPTPTSPIAPPPTPPEGPLFRPIRIADEILGFQKLAPSLLDYDGDGKSDQLLFGEANGGLYFANHLGAGVFSSPVAVQALTSSDPLSATDIQVGAESVPFLVDADGDGLVDLFVGAKDGLIRAYRNVAPSAFQPPVFRQIFDEVLRISEGIDLETGENLNLDGSNEPVEVPGGVAPTLGDLNGDGIIDLVIGNADGEVIFYKGFAEQSPSDFFNETSFINRLFVPDETLFIYKAGDDGGLAIPSLADIDLVRDATGDPVLDPFGAPQAEGDLDVLCGRFDGFLRLWESRLEQGEYIWPFEEFPDPELGFPKFPVLRFLNPPDGFVYEEILPATPEANPIRVTGRAAPSIGRLFGTSELDLVVGSDEGLLYVFQGVSAPTEEMALEPPAPDQESAVAVNQTGDLRGSWGGIWFKGASLDWDDTQPERGSLIENALITGAKVGVRARSASPRIVKTDILDSLLYGLVAENMAFPSIENVNIASNSSVSIAGVMADNYSAPVMEDVRLVRNGYAGLQTKRYAFPVLRGSHPAYGHSIVTGNRYGVRIESNSAPRLGNVSNANPNDNGLIEFYGNRLYDIYNDTSALIMAENNLWNTMDLAAIDKRIFDDNENPEKGMVDFYPLARFTPDAPPTPTPTPTMNFVPYPTATPTPKPEVAIEASGTITQNTTWQGTVTVTGNVTILDSAVLEILPGTLIRFRGVDASGSPAKWVIHALNATILARGTRQKPIQFLPESFTEEQLNPLDPQRPYGGVVLDGPSMIRSEFIYCEFHLADVGVEAKDNSVLMDECEFSLNRKGVIVRATGAMPGNLVAPKIRRTIFDRNLVAFLVAGSANPDFGKPEDPGLNVFLLLDERPTRYDFEVDNYFRGGPFSAQGNYFYVQDTARLLANYADLKGRFSPIPEYGLYESDENPAGAVNAFPVGKMLEDDMDGMPGIIITHPEVWIGDLYYDQDILILSRVRIIRGSRLFAVGEEAPSIVVGTGDLITPELTRSLSGTLEALGEPDAGEIIMQGYLFAPETRTLWGGLCFVGQNASQKSYLRNVRLRNSVNQLTLLGASPTLEDCIVEVFTGAGIVATHSIHPDDDYHFPFATRAVDSDTGVGFNPKTPYGVPQPRIERTTITGGTVGVLSFDARPILRRNFLYSSRIASVLISGGLTPDLGTLADPGYNYFRANDDYDVINLALTQVGAAGNVWYHGEAPLQTPVEIDSRIFDDEENYSSGAVDYSGFIVDVTAIPTLERFALGDLDENSLINHAGILEVIKAWHTIKGSTLYNKAVNSSGGVVIDYKDLFYRAAEWNKTALPVKKGK